MRSLLFLPLILILASCSHTQNEKELYQRLDLLHERNDSLQKILRICRENFRMHIDEDRQSSDPNFNYPIQHSFEGSTKVFSADHIRKKLLEHHNSKPKTRADIPTEAKLIGLNYAITSQLTDSINHISLYKYQLAEGDSLRWEMIEYTERAL